MSSVRDLRDLFASLVLSECVYKKVDMQQEELAGTVTEFVRQFPGQLLQVKPAARCVVCVGVRVLQCQRLS